MILYLVAATEASGVAEAAAREGWVRISATRFAAPGRHDVRVIRRVADLIVGQGPAVCLIKGADYESGPAVGLERDPLAWQRWEQEKPAFDSFVAAGGGRWIDDLSALVEKGEEDVQIADQTAGF